MYRRKSIRLPGYDYSGVGAYFITVCTDRREPLLGEIVGSEARLTDYGKAAAGCWQWLPRQYRFVQLDAWVIMPNHLHGIV
jgi:putative transposase